MFDLEDVNEFDKGYPEGYHGNNSSNGYGSGTCSGFIDSIGVETGDGTGKGYTRYTGDGCGSGLLQYRQAGLLFN